MKVRYIRKPSEGGIEAVYLKVGTVAEVKPGKAIVRFPGALGDVVCRLSSLSVILEPVHEHL